MSVSDPIADMLTKIRNASLAKYEKVDIPSSKLKVEIVKILKNEGFIRIRDLSRPLRRSARMERTRSGFFSNTMREINRYSADCGVCRLRDDGCTRGTRACPVCTTVTVRSS